MFIFRSGYILILCSAKGKLHFACGCRSLAPGSSCLAAGCFQSVRFRRGSVSRYSLNSMASLWGGAPHNSRVGWSGRRAPALPPGKAGASGGDAAHPSRMTYLMSVSVWFGICFGLVGFALQPYMKLDSRCLAGT